MALCIASVRVLLLSLVMLPCSVKSYRTQPEAKDRSAIQAYGVSAGPTHCSLNESIALVDGWDVWQLERIHSLQLERIAAVCGDCVSAYSSAFYAAGSFQTYVNFWKKGWGTANLTDRWTSVGPQGKTGWGTEWKKVKKTLDERLATSSQKSCVLDKCIAKCLVDPALPCSGACDAFKSYHGTFGSLQTRYNDALLSLKHHDESEVKWPIGELKGAGLLSDDDENEIHHFDWQVVKTNSVENCTSCDTILQPRSSSISRTVFSALAFVTGITCAVYE